MDFPEWDWVVERMELDRKEFGRGWQTDFASCCGLSAKRVHEYVNCGIVPAYPVAVIIIKVLANRGRIYG